MAVLAALFHRQKTGEGQLIEVPMFETLTAFWLTDHLFGRTFDPPTGDMGYDRIINKNRHPFPTKDGYVCALPYTDRHWARFFELCGRAELSADPRFVDGPTRAQHFSELYQVLGSLLVHRTTAEWLAVFDEADIPCMPVNSLEDLLEDPHLKEVGFFTERDHPTEGKVTTFASPLDFSKTPTSFRRHAPRIGADGVEVLKEMGYGQGEIDGLLAGRALIAPA